jgi:hypothetical protein
MNGKNIHVEMEDRICDSAGSAIQLEMRTTYVAQASRLWSNWQCDLIGEFAVWVIINSVLRILLMVAIMITTI